MTITYKDFEIREIKNSSDLEIVKWEGPMASASCFVVAFLRWNEKDMTYSLQSVGTRLLDYWVDGMEKFIGGFAHYYEQVKNLQEFVRSEEI